MNNNRASEFLAARAHYKLVRMAGQVGDYQNALADGASSVL